MKVCLFDYLFYCVSSINGQLVNRRMCVVSSIRMNNLFVTRFSGGNCLEHCFPHICFHYDYTITVFLYKDFNLK